MYELILIVNKTLSNLFENIGFIISSIEGTYRITDFAPRFNQFEMYFKPKCFSGSENQALASQSKHFQFPCKWTLSQLPGHPHLMNKHINHCHLKINITKKNRITRIKSNFRHE